MNLALLFSRPSATSARLIAEFYALLGVAWVWASDLLRPVVAPSPGLPGSDHLELLNRLGFVAASALALYGLLLACHRRIDRAHRAELAAASRYRALLETSLDAIHVLDAEGRLLEANHAFYKHLRIDEASACALNVADWDARLSRPELLAKIAELLDRSAVFETLHRRRDGALVEVEISATGVNLEGQRVLVCAARDLTARRQLERAQLRAERLESLGLLAGGVAHDLNNALAPVLLGSELLRTRLPAAADDPVLDSMSSAARRGAGIIRQLLTFARGVEGERQPVPVYPLLAGLAQITEAELGSRLRVELLCAPDLPPVRGDAAQLHQVLLSLLRNARDAMPGGGRLVLGARLRELSVDAAAVLPGARPGPHLELFVRDHGPGLSADAREHLFEPFFTTKPRGQGTGLGLSTALGIVRSHGGTLEHVAPTAGGAEFRVLLPVCTPKTETPPTAPATEPAAPIAPTPRGAGRKILLVEDDAPVRLSTRLLLERHGFRVRETEDGTSALAALAEPEPPALVLTDLMMPGLPGDALARRVRERHPGLPVLMMTGLHPDDPNAPNLRALLAEGTLADLLHKPFDEAQLLAGLARAFEAPAR